MANLILPSRRTRQPQTIARPSNYWLSRGLVFLYNGATFVDHCSNIPGTNNGGIARRANVGGGIAADISGTQYLSWASRDALNLTGPLSIFWRGVFDATTGAYRTVVTKAQTSGASDTPFESYLDTSSGKLLLFRAAAAGFRSYTSNTSTPSAGVVTSIGAMFDSGDLASSPTVYIDKTLQSISTGGILGSGAVTSNTADLRIGRRPDNATQLDGGVELVALFNQALSADKYLRLQRDPWGELFAPDPRRLYFGFTSSSGAVTGTSSSSVDTFTGTADADLTIAATSAATVSAVSGATDADILVAATSSATVGSTTGSTDADVIVTAASAQTIGTTTGTASGTVISGAVGTSAATVGTTTGTTDADVLLAATSSATIGVTGTAAGAVALIVTSAQTVNDVTGSAFGTSTGAAAGTSSATVGTTTGTAAGYVDVLGSASATVGVTGSASGTLGAGPVAGTSSATLAALSGTAAAQIIVSGSSVGQLGGVVGAAAQTITSVDTRYLARSRGRRFTAIARGRQFIART